MDRHYRVLCDLQEVYCKRPRRGGLQRHYKVSYASLCRLARYLREQPSSKTIYIPLAFGWSATIFE